VQQQTKRQENIVQCEPHFMSQVKITLLESSNIKSYLGIAFGKNSGLWLLYNKSFHFNEIWVIYTFRAVH